MLVTEFRRYEDIGELPAHDLMLYVTKRRFRGRIELGDAAFVIDDTGTVHVAFPLLGIDDVDGSISALEAALNERQQDAVLFLFAAKERADVSRRRKLGARKL